MSKMNLTEATMLALQGKLVENKASKRPKKVAKKVESIDVNVDDNTTVSVDTTTTVVETPDATIIIEEPVAEPEIVEPIETVEVPVEGDETIIPEEIIEPEAVETAVEDELDVEVAEDEDDEEEFVESVKVTENKKLQEEVDEEAYSIAEKIAKEIEEKGIMNFEEVDARIIELSSKTEEEILNSDFKNSVYGCLNFEGIDQNFSTGDFFTQTYAEEHPEVLEESKKVEENIDIEISEDGKEIEVTTDDGEEVEVKDETPDDSEEPAVEDGLDENKKLNEEVTDDTIVKIEPRYLVGKDGKHFDQTVFFKVTYKVVKGYLVPISEEIVGWTWGETDKYSEEGNNLKADYSGDLQVAVDDINKGNTSNYMTVDSLSENKKLNEDYSAAPFRDLMYDCMRDDIEPGDVMADRMLSAWSDDDCKWYCETYELVEILPDCTDERYYKDIWGNIRDISGQIVEEELEENKEVKEEAGAAALLGGVALGAVADAVVDRVHNVLGSVNEAIKYSSKSFNEALTKFYKKENSKVESVKLTKFASLKENIKLEAKIKFTDETEKDVCLEMKPTSTNKSFVRYSLEEVSSKKTEGKTNNQSLNMLTYKTNKNVLECRYISKK